MSSAYLNEFLPVLLLLPLAGGVLTLFGKLFQRTERLFTGAAVFVQLGCLLYTVAAAPLIAGGDSIRYALGSWPEPYGIALVLDGFAWISCALIALISLIVAVNALSSRRSDGTAGYGASFFFFYLLLTAGMYGVALSGDLFTMFVGFEIIAIAAYVLIAYEKSPAGLVASFKYLILSSTGILFFLFGVFLIYRDLGTLSISIASRMIAESLQPGGAPVIHLALAALCVGIGVRTAFIPFHTWLPEAHAYAPHPVSALLSGVLIKVSFFSMIRLVLSFSGGYLNPLLLWIGALTALSAVISALVQSDAKRLLAYHSISQMGYILAVFGAASSLALSAAFMHAVNHALFKSLLFLTVGAAVHRSGVRNLYKMPPMGRDMPLHALAFFAGALSIAGMPPFNGYASKALISAGMKGSPAYWLLWITSFATVASFIKLSRIFLPIPIRTQPGGPKSRPLASVTVLVLAVLCLFFGIEGIRSAAWLQQMLEPAASEIDIKLYTPAKLYPVVWPLSLGIVLYLVVATQKGKQLAGVLKGLTPNLNTVLLFFLFGLSLFAAAAWV